MRVKLRIFSKKFDTKTVLSTKLVMKDKTGEAWYTVYFKKDIKEAAMTKVNINRGFNITIDEENIGYDKENKRLYIKSADFEAEEIKSNRGNFETVPKFTDVFEFPTTAEDKKDELLKY